MVAIYCAYQSADVSALIIFYLLISLISCTLYWIFANWRPSLSKIRKSLISEHWNYGKNLLASSIIVMLSKRLDLIIMSKYLATSFVGLLLKAREYNNLVALSSSKLASRPALAIFSNFKENKEKHHRIYINSLSIISSAYATGLGLLVVNIDWIILYLLGAEWMKMIILLKILLLGSSFFVISNFSKYVLLSLGLSKAVSKITIHLALIRVLTIIIICLILYTDGMSLILAIVCAEFFFSLYQWFLISQLICKTMNLTKPILYRHLIPFLLIFSATVTSIVISSINSDIATKIFATTIVLLTF